MIIGIVVLVSSRVVLGLDQPPLLSRCCSSSATMLTVTVRWCSTGWIPPWRPESAQRLGTAGFWPRVCTTRFASITDGQPSCLRWR